MLCRFIVWGCEVLTAERPRNDGSPSSTEVLEGLVGVTDGARTRDTQDHNLVLYQLNSSSLIDSLMSANALWASPFLGWF